MSEADEINKLAEATQKLRDAEDKLAYARSDEAKQVANLEKQTERLNDQTKAVEQSYAQWADLGKELKDGMFAPLKGIISAIPGPLQTIGKLIAKGAMDLGSLIGIGGKKEKNPELEQINEGIQELVDQGEGPDSSTLNELGMEEGDEGVGEGDDSKKPGGLFGKGFKKIGEWIKKFLKWKTLIIGVLAAIVGGLAIKYWEPIKEFVVDKIIPAIKSIVGLLTPIVAAIKEVAGWIILAFTDPKAALDALWSGISDIAEYIYNNVLKPAWDWITLLFTDPVAALKQLVAGFGSLVDWIFNNTYLKAWNWITGLFDFEPVANTFSLWDTISAVFDEVKAWFMGLFTWGRALGTTKDGTWSLTTMIDNAFTLVKEWVMGLFTWARAAGETADGKWSLTTMIDAAFLKAKEWAVSLFTWATDPEGESWIQKTVSAAVTKVKAWATSLFTWSSTDNPDDPWLTTKIKEAINLVKDWVTGLFSWASTAGQVDGAPWSLFTMVDAAVLKVKDWVVSLFTWATEPVKPEDSWIKKTINAVITKVQTWALSLFTWAEEPGESWISTTIKNVIKTVKAWVTGLFSWVSEAGKVDGEEWSLSTMVDAAFKKAKDWIVDLFSWGKGLGEGEDGKWSLTTMLLKVVKGIKDYFWNDKGTGLLNFDFGQVLPDFSFDNLFGGIADMFNLDNILATIGQKIADMDFKFGFGWLKSLLLKVFNPSLASSVNTEVGPSAPVYAGPAAAANDEMANKMYSNADAQAPASTNVSSVDASTQSSNVTHIHNNINPTAGVSDGHTDTQKRFGRQGLYSN